MSIFFWKKKKSEPEPETAAETPAAETPVEEMPAEETPAEETPAEADTPEEEVPAADASAEETPAEEVPAEADTPEEPVAETTAAETPEQEQDLGDTQVFEPVKVPDEDTAGVPSDASEDTPDVSEVTEESTYEVPAVIPDESAFEEPAVVPEEEPAPVAAYEPEDDYEEKKPRRKSRALLWIFLLLFVIAGCYYCGYTYSQTHFLENTFINGIDVSNMTAPEVEKILSKKAEGYELKITFRDGEVEVIDGDAIGYKVKPDGSVDRILQSQDHKEWFRCFFRRTDGEVEQHTTYDPNRLKAAVSALPELQEDRMVAPKDAYIVLQDTTFTIVPEVEGSLVDIGIVQNAATEAVSKEQTDIVVTDLEGSYKVPSVRAQDAAIVEKCDEYNEMLAGSITWNMPNGESLTVDKNTTVNWLSRDENGEYYRDEDLWEENIEFWVDELARNVNTVGKDWTFHSTNRGDITISGGDYGYSVNKVKEREEVWDLLWDGDTDDREPYFYSVQFNHGSGLGGTYIEANLSSQHVWIYVDGTMVCETDCVSGNTSLGRGTPTGVFQILYKDTDVDLKGQQLANGQYSYISHVNYWMPFYGGCGFHDASWRSRFGGSIYKSDGSHGCINLPPSITPKFYGYVSKGMPVIVYY
ncbi:MAG: peptidoglycan binding domain-containing protein [Lachnospiraceae bacterium]|nr:peptidoglycan binding domain-containing protein [Lachnospiraceae bacterium]